jgi:hypothetical protein
MTTPETMQSKKRHGDAFTNAGHEGRQGISKKKEKWDKENEVKK